VATLARPLSSVCRSMLNGPSDRDGSVARPPVGPSASRTLPARASYLSSGVPRLVTTHRSSPVA
jgi:hypothetical protein